MTCWFLHWKYLIFLSQNGNVGIQLKQYYAVIIARPEKCILEIDVLVQCQLEEHRKTSSFEQTLVSYCISLCVYQENYIYFYNFTLSLLLLTICKVQRKSKLKCEPTAQHLNFPEWFFYCNFRQFLISIHKALMRPGFSQTHKTKSVNDSKRQTPSR